MMALMQIKKFFTSIKFAVIVYIIQILISLKLSLLVGLGLGSLIGLLAGPLGTILCGAVGMLIEYFNK